VYSASEKATSVPQKQQIPMSRILRGGPAMTGASHAVTTGDHSGVVPPDTTRQGETPGRLHGLSSSLRPERPLLALPARNYRVANTPDGALSDSTLARGAESSIYRKDAVRRPLTLLQLDSVPQLSVARPAPQFVARPCRQGSILLSRRSVGADGCPRMSRESPP
jgi:hypothetical protein